MLDIATQARLKGERLKQCVELRFKASRTADWRAAINHNKSQLGAGPIHRSLNRDRTFDLHRKLTKFPKISDYQTR